MHERIEVDISYITYALNHSGFKHPQKEFKFPFLIKIPSERNKAGVNSMEIITPIDTHKTILYHHSVAITQYSVR